MSFQVCQVVEAASKLTKVRKHAISLADSLVVSLLLINELGKFS